MRGAHPPPPRRGAAGAGGLSERDRRSPARRSRSDASSKQAPWASRARPREARVNEATSTASSDRREAHHLHAVERAGESAETPLIAILGLALTVASCSQRRTFGSNIDIFAPATFVSLIIPLAVFFAFQRYFVQGAPRRVGQVTATDVPHWASPRSAPAARDTSRETEAYLASTRASFRRYLPHLPLIATITGLHKGAFGL
jgi:hypothetical protein